MVTITRKSLDSVLRNRTQPPSNKNNYSDSRCGTDLALTTKTYRVCLGQHSSGATKAPHDLLGCRFSKQTEHADYKKTNDDDDTKCKNNSMNGLETVSLDVWIHIFLFLTVPETRSLRQVNTRFRNLLDMVPTSSSDDGSDSDQQDNTETALQYLWNEHARRMWPYYNLSPFTRITLSAIDATVSSSPSRLLALARPAPWCMQVIHEGVTCIRTVQVAPAPKEETSNHSQNVHGDYIQYTGRIGHGNRCIRANLPLPQPIVCCSDQRNDNNNNHHRTVAATNQKSPSCSSWSLQPWLVRPISTRCVCSYCKRLHQSRNRHRRRPFSFLVGGPAVGSRSLGLFPGSAFGSSGGWLRPFCIPQVQGNGSVMISPRLVAYFEVAIRRAPADDVPSPEQPFRPHSTTTGWEHTTLAAELRHHPHPSRHPSTGMLQQPQQEEEHSQIESEIDCIAIGICTRSFRWNCRMPGWDAQSIGYHSDDGALFYGSGRSILPHYGPRYGPGDVVGCGIDYARCIVFFTFNGRNLGTAKELDDHLYPKPATWWQHSSPPLQQQHEWFPVVGLDSNHLVQCNFFGPFTFDLEAYQQEQNHADVMKEALVMTRATLPNMAAAASPTTTETSNVEAKAKNRFRPAVRW